jgi:WXG100 family type VII secretion target
MCGGVTDRIAAEFGVLEKTAEEFQQTLDALKKVLTELDRDLRGSLERWEGDASEAYWKARDRWQKASADMAERLAWLHRVIVTAHGNYRISQVTNVKMWDVA